MARRYGGSLDKTICFATAALLLLGVLFLYSATYNMTPEFSKSLLLKHVLRAVIGILCLLMIVGIDYQRIIDASYVIYAVNVFLLVMLLFMGDVRLGAQRWFAIGGLTVQPAEFIKISLILALAAYIGHKRQQMDDPGSLAAPFALAAVPFFLIVAQPDLGTALLLLPILLAMLFIGGSALRHLCVISGLGIMSMPLFWRFLRDYQKDRLLVFINPNVDPLGAGYTIIQSKIAVGSGGLFGKGWLSGTQSQFNFLTERHTDFIFSVVGEEWGFVGSMVLVALYLLIILRAFSILNSTNDIYGKLIVAGVISLLSVQVFVNLGMAIGIMPVVGLPLPLISYGGSSLIATLIAIGLLLNIGLRRSIF
ncbi:rod shape-determining protein RodA [Candidatus Omnitrophota bacterium]